MMPNDPAKEELNSVLAELIQREPIFHRTELGLTQADFEQQMDSSFWEIGASGKIYNRDYILAVLDERHKNPIQENWQTSDFHCMKIADNNYLLSYLLTQDNRITRRTTIWRNTINGWKILFHQGTVIEHKTVE